MTSHGSLEQRLNTNVPHAPHAVADAQERLDAGLRRTAIQVSTYSSEVETTEGVIEAIAYVYVPTRPYNPVPPGTPQPVEFELRQLADGSAGLAVFTNQDRLTDALGSFQPRVRLPILELLLQLASEQIPVVINPTLKKGADKWTEIGLRMWRRGQYER